MISRSQRISAEQLDLIIEKGRVFHSPLFVVRTLSGQSGVRVAAIAPKKIASTAATRNAIRRKIYAAVRPLTAHINFPVFIALFAKQQVHTTSVTDLKAHLQELFVKAGLLS